MWSKKWARVPGIRRAVAATRLQNQVPATSSLCEKLCFMFFPSPLLYSFGGKHVFYLNCGNTQAELWACGRWNERVSEASPRALAEPPLAITCKALFNRPIRWLPKNTATGPGSLSSTLILKCHSSSARSSHFSVSEAIELSFRFHIMEAGWNYSPYYILHSSIYYSSILAWSVLFCFNMSI